MTPSGRPTGRVRLRGGPHARGEGAQPTGVDALEKVHGVPVAAVFQQALRQGLPRLLSPVLRSVIPDLCRDLPPHESPRFDLHQLRADHQEIGQRIGQRIAPVGLDLPDVLHVLIRHVPEGERRDVEVVLLHEAEQQVERAVVAGQAQVDHAPRVPARPGPSRPPGRRAARRRRYVLRAIRLRPSRAAAGAPAAGRARRTAARAPA